MKKRWLLFAIGFTLILVGSAFAAFIHGAGGVRIQDVRFEGTKGARMSALLYIPPNATERTPAPGVLAVHGYMNSREMQSAFAIELARRGHVVLALDQMGHGNSSPPAFANGFGGPDGLKYLRSLPFVDKNNIGMEGHSMGGWAILAAAAAMPDGYKSLILNGSSTGKPFAADGTPTWPRNLALSFGRYDEFAPFFWGAPDARRTNESKKLAVVFGHGGTIEPGKVYGSIEAGTARVLFQPSETHAQNHISHETVGHTIDWFQRTLAGSKPLPATDQVWIWKEIGTLIALAGFIVLLLGTFQVLLSTGWFAGLAAIPPVHQGVERTPRWWLAFALTTLIPAITFFPLTGFGRAFLPAKAWLPQEVTNWIMAWALGNALLVFALTRFFRSSGARFSVKIGPAAGIALATVAAGYIALLAAEALFMVDFRYWVVTLQPMTGKQFVVFLIYLIPFTAFFLVALRALHSTLPLDGEVGARHYLLNALALALGFGVLLAIEYGALFATGALILPTGNPLEALITIIGIQFLVLLPVGAVISTFAYARTNSYVPGALICGLLVTWYIAASQATQGADLNRKITQRENDMRRNTIAVAVSIAVAAAFSPGASAQAPAVKSLKLQSSWPSSLTIHDHYKGIVDRIEKLTAGSIKIDAMTAGQVVPPFEVLDATHKKVIDGFHSAAYYWVGKSPAAALFAGTPGGPYGMDHMDYLGWMYNGGGLELWRDLYQNELKLNVLSWPAQPTSPQALGWFKKPLKSVADFKGMKCRQTGLNSEVYAKLGQAVVNLPAGEIVPAAQRGVIDCAEWVGGIEDLRLGLPGVFKYHYTPGMHEPNNMGEFGLNLDVWKGFTPQQQEAVNSAIKDTFITWLTRWQVQNAEAMAEMTTKHGVQIRRTPPDILIATLKAWDEVAAEYSAKSPTFKKVYESQRAYAAKVVPAKRYMFPPYSFAANYYWPEAGAKPAAAKKK